MLKLETRPEPSRLMSVLSPLLALAITVLIGIVLFALLGKDPVRGLQVFFWEPIKSTYALSELMVKATPLLIIALGLAVCFRSNVWNIGAEGQFVIGAVVAGWRRRATRRACSRCSFPTCRATIRSISPAAPPAPMRPPAR